MARLTMIALSPKQEQTVSLQYRQNISEFTSLLPMLLSAFLAPTTMKDNNSIIAKATKVVYGTLKKYFKGKLKIPIVMMNISNFYHERFHLTYFPLYCLIIIN